MPVSHVLNVIAVADFKGLGLGFGLVGVGPKGFKTHTICDILRASLGQSIISMNILSNQSLDCVIR